MTARDDVWREVITLLAVTPALVTEALDACDPAEEEEVLEAVAGDCAAILTMLDDPEAVFAFSPISTLLRRLAQMVDRSAATSDRSLPVRLRRFVDAFTLLRDLDAHHRLPALAPDRKE